MADGFTIKGIEDFEKRLRQGTKTFPKVVQNVLESLGEELLGDAAQALKEERRPHATYAVRTHIRTRGPNKGKARNYLQFIGTTSRSSIDTGALWRSLSRGARGNVWMFTAGGTRFALTVGSGVNYARYINDGYKVSKAHWVPGVVDGNGIFRYAPGADTGIWVKPRKFKGIKFMESALEDLQAVAPGIIEEEVRRWLASVEGK